MYEFKMALFDNADLEEFLLFQWNCQFTIKASGIITAGEKIQFLHNLLRGEYLGEFKTLCGYIGDSNKTHLNQILLGLGTFFLSMYGKRKSMQCSMERGIRVS